jgi:hypothetical protein
MIFKNQKEMFEYIWDTSPHVSEISRKQLLPKGHFQWHWQFLHVLPKGSYPKYKYESDNIILATVQEHEHQNEYDYFNEKRDELRKRYYKEFYNKTFEE